MEQVFKVGFINSTQQLHRLRPFRGCKAQYQHGDRHWRVWMRPFPQG